MSQQMDVFARNLSTDVTELMSVNKTNDGGGNFTSYRPVINADGSVVAFASAATNLHPADVNELGYSDVFVRNQTADLTLLVASGNGNSFGPSLNSFGNLVSFYSGATNLHPLDTSLNADVYVRNLGSGVLTLASRNDAGTAAGNSGSSGGCSVRMAVWWRLAAMPPILRRWWMKTATRICLSTARNGDVELGSKRAAIAPPFRPEAIATVRP